MVAGIVEKIEIVFHVVEFPPSADIDRIAVKVIDLRTLHRQNEGRVGWIVKGSKSREYSPISLAN